MAKTIEIPDGDDSWAEVELYRWQHGHLPGEPGHKERPLSVPAGLRGMADAIAKRDTKNFPDPFNVMMVLRYAAKIIERLEGKKTSTGLDRPLSPPDAEKVGRNEPCPCRSGQKWKHCHGRGGATRMT